ncbi:MAG TPA: SDR family NAD(P)-dependent oxidoreductase [Myxococcota bacterium]|nr:SDR family NAD(P)-dependent oxidoreductase [Myxococcota bacterium]HQP96211.1 SDR family NAD(P)-dependent oxidoreductase [Myxococcota bacterium]
MKNILILGASSGIAREVARLLCRESRLILAGNDPDVLNKIASDLELRSQGNKPVVVEFDARNTAGHGVFMQNLLANVERIDEAWLFFGAMVDEADAHRRPELAATMAQINYVGAMTILEHIALHMEQNRAGLIAAVSSVAGDRGRASNYLYGSTKAGLTAYLSGLRARLAASGVHVTTLKPGFVDTPMTATLKKGLLTSQPDKVARCMLRAARHHSNTAYVPFFWGFIMFVIIHLPEFIFKKVKF